MAIIHLNKLTLKNFMGIRDFTLECDGQDVVVKGKNGAGKTTIANAFSWVLTGKDSAGNAPGTAKFPVKTTDENNNPIHKLEHEAEVVLDIDGREMALKKVYKEKWTAKKGQSVKELTGHETKHFIDGVPLSEKEFQARLSKIADEKTFRLLTDPLYFSSGIEWKERRNLLFEICGDLTDEEVIASNPKLALLPQILDGRDIEDYKAIVKSAKKAAEKEKNGIPDRINENLRTLQSLGNVKDDGLQEKLAKKRQELQEKQQELARIESGGEVAELKKKLAEAEAELLTLKNEARGGVEKLIDDKRQKLAEVNEKGQELSFEVKRIEGAIQENQKKVEQYDGKLYDLAIKWCQVDEREFTFEQSDNCPTCGQPLPEEQLEEARQKAEEEFNLKKAQELEKIDEEGQELSELIKSLKEENETLQKQLEETKEQLAETRKEYVAIQNEIASLQEQGQVDNPAITTKENQILDLQIAINDLKVGNQKSIDKVQGEINTIQAEIDNLEKAKANVETYQKTQARIKELEAEEKRLATEIERLNGEEWLMEEFVRAKCSLITDNINSHFKIAKFKLFDKLVNGALVEVCEVLGDGIPFNGGLNQGHQLLIGVDIINTLQKHFGIVAPIFIDRSESLTEPVETEAQLIRLKAVEGVDRLTVEVS